MGLSDDEYFTSIKFKLDGTMTLDYIKDSDFIDSDKWYLNFSMFLLI